ncbi:MAG: alpha amylase C-terminal domain-containing protein [Opitutaceae bacterium]|nr:alpha amylase C-terminal domain-containing protein [Cytophagales bacterium]
MTKKLALLNDDPWLEPFESDIEARLVRLKGVLSGVEKSSKSLYDFAGQHHYLGVHYNAALKAFTYREWAPGAFELYLIGDFNNWDRTTHPLSKTKDGVWEIILPESEYKDTFLHESKIKVHVVAKNGRHDRIPAYIKRVVQNTNNSDYSGQVWLPKTEFSWTDSKYNSANEKSLLIYECHIGMAQEKEGLGTYVEFADVVLPRAKALGYNAIQLMAVMEHPYYGSYGYHVSNFFCPSSRFGTPDELKYLVNKAHELGIAVIMDIVHSHSVKNFAEGLNEFDGTDKQYFHQGGRGYHDLWDSFLFDYGKKEVMQFLLSNVRYWLEEFHFDGYRFDGITSMMYFHHGNSMTFDHYEKYFKEGVDWDCLTYLQLANMLIKKINPNALSIAEDMSGMPGLCRTVEDGGIGFDYRLAMGIPDYWIKLLKEKPDEEWNIYEMWGVLNNRRWREKTIAYAESHDQALVGDKTLAFWLMDQEMYWHMAKDDHNIVIDRGIALHKMIRLFTIALGGEAYLNFFGNEFGHPEWIDFPREGNGWSYKYARRQWSLADNKQLKYHYLSDFDKQMLKVINDDNVLNAEFANQLNMDGQNKVIVFERGNLIFVFNFHTYRSIFDYKFWVPKKGKYKMVLNSDDVKYGGHNRVDASVEYFTQPGHDANSGFLSLYLTNRSCFVLKKVD